METLMIAELDMKHKQSAIPAVAPRFDRWKEGVEADVLLSLALSDVFADQARYWACVVADQVQMLKHGELLTKKAIRALAPLKSKLYKEA